MYSQGEAVSTEIRRYVKITPELWERFLQDYAELGNLTAAASKNGTSKQAIHAHVKANPEKAQELDVARGEAQQAIEAEIRRRAIEGWDEPVFFQGEEVGVVRRYSDKMLEILAKANMPERYGNKTVHEVKGTITHEHKAKQRLAALLNVSGSEDDEEGEIIDAEFEEEPSHD